MAGTLSGGSGLSGTDSQELNKWLLQYGQANTALRREMGMLAEWMVNSIYLWHTCAL